MDRVLTTHPTIVEGSRIRAELLMTACFVIEAFVGYTSRFGSLY